jgi:hypothetical protein
MLSEGGFGPEDVVFFTDVLEDVWAESHVRDIQNTAKVSAERERLAAIIIGLAPLARSDDAERFKARVKNRFELGA